MDRGSRRKSEAIREPVENRGRFPLKRSKNVVSAKLIEQSEDRSRWSSSEARLLQSEDGSTERISFAGLPRISEDRSRPLISEDRLLQAESGPRARILPVAAYGFALIALVMLISDFHKILG